MKTNYTREELINICEQAFVPQSSWMNRDSASSQLGVGKAYALLKAGCEFEVETTEDGKGCSTNDETIWLQFYVHDFAWFEYACDDPEDKRGTEDSDYHFYLPTQKRLDERKGNDWY